MKWRRLVFVVRQNEEEGTAALGDGVMTSVQDELARAPHAWVLQMVISWLPCPLVRQTCEGSN